ncbi:MAG TPA: 16S rRNA (guanine(966)-N(2))-methyltransferase RsmD [Acidimicrobiales bacterium]|nr:16S rRNA (guanine(966)-N(2))-methyltransferase RsmD [Acidimicrobiales bacterium]
MRVVGGSERGRALRSPKGHDIRPTSDRVREAVFNMVDTLGGVDDATVVDLFAGTGALGIEALSRGAASAVFVERDRSAAALVQENLDALGLAERGKVVRLDVVRWLETAGPFEVAFADPPYAFEQWPVVFERVRAQLLVAESNRELDLGGRWELLRCKRYGSTVVHVAHTALDSPGDLR